uniref:Gypsy retrotransposon integrase-like protein 1 n=1 Tax=Dicentrarchus labrax TaxID=13489 RepID=A0A8P4K456_DICLA
MRVIAYASRGLSRSESRYPAHKLEFLALKWAVVEKFNDYLYVNQFTVMTDSNPLTYILTTAKLDATSYRWLAALSAFTFKLQYRAGKLNTDADGLSRRPHGELSNDLKSQKEQERICQFTQTHLADLGIGVSQDIVHAICERHLVCMATDECRGNDEAMTLVQSLAISPEALPDSFVNERQHGGPPDLPHLSEREIRDKQRADPCLREVIAHMENGEKLPPTVRKELPDVSFFLREWNRLELHNEVLYRRHQASGRVTHQLVLPEERRAVVMQSLHNDMGHLGIERTLDLVRTRFYWPKMAADVEKKVKTCDRCIRRKAQPEKAAPLVNIKSTRPLELVCMDFLSLEPDTSNTKDILVITDHFTKYAVAIPTPNQRAQTVARCLWDNFMVHYGIPERLHSDQGPDFESRMIKELCKVAGIHKIRTTPYHPRGNPVERFNRTLLNMLGTLDNKDKSQWRNFVKPLVHAYNCTKNDVTGFTPYELMFGRQPRLPVDLAFALPLRDGEYKLHSQYVQRLKSQLEESYEIATRNAKKIAEKNKARFDRHVTASKLEVGDRVLVRAVRLRGKHKLADKWESDIYVVVKQAGDLPVYTVRPENKESPLRTLHRDLLLPCGSLPQSDEKPDLLKPCRPKTRQSAKESQSDSEDDIPYEWFREQPDTEIGRFTTVYEIPKVNIHPESTLSKGEERNVPKEHLPVNAPVGEGHLSVDAPVGEEDLPASLSDESCSAEVGDLSVTLPAAADLECSPATADKVPEKETKTKEPTSVYLPFNVPEPVENDPTADETLKTPEKDVPAEKGERELENASAVTNDAVPGEDAATDGQGSTVRRSMRNRERPERLQYSYLGSPLVSIVQSLFQGLSSAFTDVLLEAENSKTHLSSPFRPVTTQPLPCTGTCLTSRGEGVTKVK